ncbi:uncharacterized protein Tco025E_06454 [Trypanosoma conorhini]|uniref:Uncharacterized protein n=1 Tax=Trypanosoma conorhini TaxID=83891 RepID=A0A3R7LER0_9TRYP|nr:uncharacterized protein Tco025E_06454 [Trypanosoma conorhini]RNF12935.1 hypothetical protein Tco025E_06454 [Trypanosoma conorhini]
MLRLLVACGRSAADGGRDEFHTLQLLNRLLGEEAGPASHGDAAASSAAVAPAEDASPATPRSPPREARDSLALGADDAPTTVSTALVAGRPQLSAPLPRGGAGPVSDSASTLEGATHLRLGAPNSTVKNDMDPPQLEHTIAFSSRASSLLCGGRDPKMKLEWSSSISRLPPAVLATGPQDTAPAEPQRVNSPPRSAGLASVTGAAGLGARASYARRFLERLYFRDPVVVGTAGGLPPRAPTTRQKRTNPIFERCYYDASGLLFTPIVFDGAPPVRRVESERSRSALSGSDLRLERGGGGGGGSGKNGGRPSSQHVSSPVRPRVTSSLYRSRTGCAHDLRRSVRRQVQRPAQDKLQQEDATAGLCIEGQALRFSSRCPSSALVRHLRRDKKCPVGGVGENQWL